MEKKVKKISPWEETLYYGECGFYSKRFIPNGPEPCASYKEQINLGNGWETIAIVKV